MQAQFEWCLRNCSDLNGQPCERGSYGERRRSEENRRTIDTSGVDAVANRGRGAGGIHSSWWRGRRSRSLARWRLGHVSNSVAMAASRRGSGPHLAASGGRPCAMAASDCGSRDSLAGGGSARHGITTFGGIDRESGRSASTRCEPVHRGAAGSVAPFDCCRKSAPRRPGGNDQEAARDAEEASLSSSSAIYARSTTSWRKRS